ncbi:OLC1v1030416C1 [Oldenlandia corymbosa var. corymbosa]|uniref:OLC1v1030416C1 n=1 Tax=Oldenlandia corymbosa var. corymbosa TaxID=529605 RepID=A0AAV1CH15_OLDCO|nr:OLC1v1030416C1 [Oldenlandia corymbosa var. corymbosa]
MKLFFVFNCQNSFSMVATLSYSLVLPRTEASWNKIIKKQLLERKPEKAMLTFLRMRELGHSADNFTYPILLKAAANLSLEGVGIALHGQIIKTGFSDHSFVQTALLNLYSHLGRNDEAWRVFEKISAKDEVAWNSMLDAYASVGDMTNAMTIFDSIPCNDLLSWNIMVSGFARIGNLKLAESFFDQIPTRDIISWNSMILACCNAGEMKRAELYFEEAPSRNTITWNTMLTGYSGSGSFDKVIALFEEMKKDENCNPDYLTIAIVLSACANLGSLEKGKEVHIFALEEGLTRSPHVTTSLIDMYSKCGRIMSSIEVFFKSQIKDIYCWNAMISGLALHGHAFAALKLFAALMGNDLRPDDITFIALLSACAHAGLVLKGLGIFSSMEKEYGISPKLEHYGCLVDLLSRAGYLDDAFLIIESMPFEPCKSALGSLLAACVKYSNAGIAERVLALLLKRNEELSDGEYMMMANLFASCKQYDEANRWIDMMNDSGVTKTAGCSNVEVNGNIYKFLAGDNNLLMEMQLI